MLGHCSRAYLRRIQSRIQLNKGSKSDLALESCFQHRNYAKKIVKKSNSTKSAPPKQINVEQIHKPVLLNEVIEKLALNEQGGLVIDATLGLGGYTKQILSHHPSVRVLGIDRDYDALQLASTRLQPFNDRFVAKHARFSQLYAVLQRDMPEVIGKVTGVVFDLGVSSLQLDTPSRGFSFRQPGPLDMRMDALDQGLTAAHVLNTFEQDRLAQIIFELGEEPHAHAIARAIVLERKSQQFSTTQQLRDLVTRVKPRPPPGKHSDPATQTFQALRMFVNQELEEIERGLQAATALLRPGGRLVAVTFHSLEDRLVKSYLQYASGLRGDYASHRIGKAQIRPNLASHVSHGPALELVTKKAIRPTQAEVDSNPRSRSAKLRCAERTANRYEVNMSDHKEFNK
jgi:16S rRNA (cytosine1402-N4)-methyltransferase